MKGLNSSFLPLKVRRITLTIEFFYSNFKDFYNANNIVFNNKEIIYRKIYSFYYRVKDYIIIKKENVIRFNLSIYFKELILF